MSFLDAFFHTSLLYILLRVRIYIFTYLVLAFSFPSSRHYKMSPFLSKMGSILSRLARRPESNPDNTATSSFPSPPSPLGTFAVLPPEVRSLIWKALIPDRDGMPSPDEYRPINPDQLGGLLALSRASSRLHHEVMDDFHRMKTLCFAIHPANDDWRVQGMEHAKPADFRHVELARFQRIKLNLYVPDFNDPGQIRRLGTQLVNVVCMLVRFQCVFREDGVGSDKPQPPQLFLNRQGEAGWPAPPLGHHLPDMEVELVDRLENGLLWRDECPIGRFLRRGGETVYECILGVFEYLQGCPSIDIILPPHMRFPILTQTHNNAFIYIATWRIETAARDEARKRPCLIDTRSRPVRDPQRRIVGCAIPDPRSRISDLGPFRQPFPGQ